MNFEELIEYLSDQLHIDLEVESEMTVCIEVDDILTIQLEMDASNRRLILLAYILEISPGRFRENVFFQALKNNHLPTRIGTFGFYEEENTFTLHRFFPADDLNKELILSFFTQLIYVAKNWRAALDSGRPAPDETPSSVNNSSKPFGLKP